MPIPLASTSPKSIDFSPTDWPFEGTQKLLPEAAVRADWRFGGGGAGSHSAAARPDWNPTLNTRGRSITPTEFLCIEIVFISSGSITRHDGRLFQKKSRRRRTDFPSTFQSAVVPSPVSASKTGRNRADKVRRWIRMLPRNGKSARRHGSRLRVTSRQPWSLWRRDVTDMPIQLPKAVQFHRLNVPVEECNVHRTGK